MFHRLAATQLAEAGVSIVGLCEAGNWKSTEIARDHTEHSTIATESRIGTLDSRKRSIEDADNSNDIAAPAKKGSKVESTTTHQSASPQENGVSKGSNSNTTVSGVASVLRASGVGVGINDKLA